MSYFCFNHVTTCGTFFFHIFFIFWGAYLKPPLNLTIILIGSEARLESKIKEEGGSSCMQRYKYKLNSPNFYPNFCILSMYATIKAHECRWSLVANDVLNITSSRMLIFPFRNFSICSI